MLFQKLVKKEEKLALVGLGYVGMPIAVAFAKKGLNVIGFDLNMNSHFTPLYKCGVSVSYGKCICHFIRKSKTFL